MYNLEDFRECAICHDPKHLCSTGESPNQRHNPHTFTPGGPWLVMTDDMFIHLADQYRQEQVAKIAEWAGDHHV